MSGTVRVGTSGWVYRHWRGVYYPEDLPQREWFGYYARDFDTVEINNTFYRLPPAETFEHWRQVAPKGFLYAFKASRYITHVKRLREPKATLDNFFERALAADETLGPVLFQLPPRWHADAARLESFLQALPRDITSVFEFRDESWYVENIRALLQRHGAIFCIHDHSSAVSPDWVTADTVYLRFHGSSGQNYVGSYSEKELRRQADRIAHWREKGCNVFVYFNNDIDGHAVRDAGRLKKLLS